jgi:beta-alanine--pyruvate transaminase
LRRAISTASSSATRAPRRSIPALKIALAYHKLAGQSTRTRFISRERSYHGCCLGGTSLGGIPQNRNLFEPLLDVDQLRSTYSRERQAYARGEPAWGGDLADDLSTFLALDGASHIAALIVEPMTGSAGVFVSLKAIFSACARSPAPTASSSSSTR